MFLSSLNTFSILNW